MTDTNTRAPVAIIPAAGLGQRLMPVSSAIPKAMVPLAGQPLISLTINQLARQGVRRFVIVIGRHGEQLRSYVERTYGGSSLEFAFVEQTELDGPLGAVRLAQPLAGPGPQLIYLGDTLCRDPLTFDCDFVLAHPVDDQWRWCMAEATDGGTLVRLLDKPAEHTEADLALIGVYFFTDGALWRRCIEDVYASGERTPRRVPAQQRHRTLPRRPPRPGAARGRLVRLRQHRPVCDGATADDPVASPQHGLGG